MRWTMGVVAVFLSLVGALHVVVGAEAGKAAARPKRQCILFCRSIDENGNAFMTGIHSVGNGEKVCVAETSPGVNITVSRGARADGANVDITFGQAKTADDERQLRSKAPAQRDAVARPKHIVTFAAFDETLVIPLGPKLANGVVPRVEVLIGAGDVIHWNWPKNESAKRRAPEDAARQAVFDAVMATGVARISCARGSRLNALVGETAYDAIWNGIEYVQGCSEVADLYCHYCPHRFGLVNVLGTLSPMLDDDNLHHCEETLFGTVGEYYVELFDSTVLPQAVEILNRLSDQSRVSVTIYTKKPDQQLLQAIKRLRVRNVSISDANSDDSWMVHERHPASKGPSRDDRVKLVDVTCPLAEAAIPSLKKLPNLEEILILTYEHPDDAKAKQTLKAVQKALPNVESHLVFYGDRRRPAATAPKNVEVQQSRNQQRPANPGKTNGSVNMGMVTPRIIIQEEEEEKLGIDGEP